MNLLLVVTCLGTLMVELPQADDGPPELVPDDDDGPQALLHLPPPDVGPEGCLLLPDSDDGWERNGTTFLFVICVVWGNPFPHPPKIYGFAVTSVSFTWQWDLK